MSHEGTGSPRWVASVSARTLGRETAAILERVAEKRHPILVTRGGLPVAILQPLDGIGFQPFDTDAGTAAGSGTHRATPDRGLTEVTEHELTEVECRLLLMLDDGIAYVHAGRYLPGDGFNLKLTRLEARGLLSRRLMSYHLTDVGERAVAVLRLAGWSKERAGTWIKGIRGDD